MATPKISNRRSFFENTTSQTYLADIPALELTRDGLLYEPSEWSRISVGRIVDAIHNSIMLVFPDPTPT